VTASDAQAFTRCIESGGVAVFPADTVYGLACDPENAAAVKRLYALKGRSPARAAAVMFFEVDAAFERLPEIGDRTRSALRRLMPGAVTALLPNPEFRFPLASGGDPGTLGLRVITVGQLRGVRVPVLQSSANFSRGADARRLVDVPEPIRAGADLLIDGGELPGTPSTVVDLRRYERGLSRAWSVVRPGAVDELSLSHALDGQFHFNPSTYGEMIRQDIPGYDEFQDALVELSGEGARRILELGTGTGETARRLLARHPDAFLVGIDESPAMLKAADTHLPPDRVDLHISRIQEPLPAGPFDLVVTALSVHHLDGPEKADLFRRVHGRLAPGGRFLLADVVVPTEPGSAVTSLTPGYDKPSSAIEQLAWLAQAGFAAHVAWEREDLAVIVGLALV
jgi:tRNA threonylcarbamoyl adenosine modification protein (Sua5/YciO/YrdC/YwlC family)